MCVFAVVSWLFVAIFIIRNINTSNQCSDLSPFSDPSKAWANYVTVGLEKPNLCKGTLFLYVCQAFELSSLNINCMITLKWIKSYLTDTLTNNEVNHMGINRPFQASIFQPTSSSVQYVQMLL